MPPKDITPEEDNQIAEIINHLFEENYAWLQLEGGHKLTPYVKEAALRQVQMYWYRLADIAMNVTDTEVRLTLPEQMSPNGRKYTIEGVVDIIRENNQTIMYDIKTHQSADVRAGLETYQRQLNVYAHIWQQLRNQELDEMAIIATAIPPAVMEAYHRRDRQKFDQELQRWDPLVNIPMEQEKVEKMISDFGTIVDQIEDKQFAPPPVETLRQRTVEGGDTFATRVCGNCDARFSCTSYMEYALASNIRRDFNISEYYADIDASEEERFDRIVASFNSETN